MNLYFFSPHNLAINLMTASFWIENNTARVKTIEVCVIKVNKVPTALTAIFHIFLAYVVPILTIWEIFCCN